MLQLLVLSTTLLDLVLLRTAPLPIPHPPCIQRVLLRLQQYDFEMHYIQGKLLTVAETLSRASLNDCTPEIEDSEIECYVHVIESNYVTGDYRLQQFQHETKTDESLQTLLTFIQNGWPKN